MTASLNKPVRLGLIGAGAIGAFHAESIARRIPDAMLSGVADPAPGAAERVAARFVGCAALTDPVELISRDDVDGVVIASPASTHTDLVVESARAGKAVFVEKPMALTLEDAQRAIDAAAAAGVPLQVGFNRRFDADFAEAHRVVADHRVGTPQLLRSLTRDPGLSNPGAVKPWTIFLETLIHDFDTVNWFNQEARAVRVFAVADALVAPAYRASGLLDTAVVTITYDNGAIAVAEASFSASYGYDVRGEVFGSEGMVTAGDVRTASTRLYDAEGSHAATARLNTQLFRQAYTDELASFVAAARSGIVSGARGEDARAALAIALAAIDSHRSGQPALVPATVGIA